MPIRFLMQIWGKSFKPKKTKLKIGEKEKRKLEILQSLGGLYDGLAFYALHWSYAPSL